eukprot:m51a1_g14717 hypothetical protein (528) ;mRNA; f:173447-175263
MANSAMPLIIINMGGEMLYILNQRLRAQNVPDDKAEKVLADVMRPLGGERFQNELFKPSTIEPARVVRNIFHKLCHSSIMRLDDQSMEKMYELMLMAFKYQAMSVRGGRDLERVTLNHLDEMASMVPHDPALRSLLEDALRERVESLFAHLTAADCSELRMALLRFVQDRRVKVALFLQEQKQDTRGELAYDQAGLPEHHAAPVGSMTLRDAIAETSRTETVFAYDSREEAETAGVATHELLGMNMYTPLDQRAARWQRRKHERELRKMLTPPPELVITSPEVPDAALLSSAPPTPGSAISQDLKDLVQSVPVDAAGDLRDLMGSLPPLAATSPAMSTPSGRPLPPDLAELVKYADAQPRLAKKKEVSDLAELLAAAEQHQQMQLQRSAPGSLRGTLRGLGPADSQSPRQLLLTQVPSPSRASSGSLHKRELPPELAQLLPSLDKPAPGSLHRREAPQTEPRNASGSTRSAGSTRRRELPPELAALLPPPPTPPTPLQADPVTPLRASSRTSHKSELEDLAERLRLQ